MVEFNKRGKAWQEICESIYNMFLQEKYTLEEGTKIDGVYYSSNNTGRFLGGAFVTRNKFSIKIYTTPDGNTIIHFNKVMSGIGGGIIGAGKMNKEFGRLKLLLQNL